MHKNSLDEVTKLIISERDLIYDEKSYVKIKKLEFDQMSLRDQVRTGNAIDKLQLINLYFTGNHVYEIYFQRYSYDESECFFRNGDVLDLFYGDSQIVDQLSKKPITGILVKSDYYSEFTLRFCTYFDITQYEEPLFSLKRSYNFDMYTKIALELGKLL